MVKTKEQIAKQMERIYRLYGQGYGTPRLLWKCEEKFYAFFMKVEY